MIRTRDRIIGKLLQVASRPMGASAREMRDCFKAKDRAAVADIRDNLIKTGELVTRSHRFPGAMKPQVRYATSAMQLDVWVANGSIKPVRRGARTIADVLAAKPVVQADVVECSSGKDTRFTFTGTPGRHVDSRECRPWAAVVCSFGAADRIARAPEVAA